ncbi:MAG: hypothetical protein WCH98_02745 [Verrucomicrobiota bacterium]
MDSTRPENSKTETGQRAKKKRSAVADLPAGISVHKLGNRSFRVRLGKKFTNGKAQTKDFTVLGRARDWIDEQTRDRSALREIQLSPEQLSQAKMAFQRLGAIPLTDAVEFFFKAGPGGRKATKLDDALALYEDHHKKAKSKEAYIKAQKISIALLRSTAGNLPIAHYTPKTLDAWFTKQRELRNWGDINTLNYVRDLKMFFRFCARQNFLAKNPLEDAVFDWVKPLRKKLKASKNVVIYSIEESRKLLDAALSYPDKDMLTWFAVCFFSGIRVEEMGRMTWECFRWDEKSISLDEQVVAKRGNPRHIALSESFKSWIRKLPDYRKRTGRLVDPTNWRNRLGDFHTAAGVPKKRNALRHTFASYHYVDCGDADKTRKMLGQKTEEVLFAHYVKLVTKKDAAAFWALRPPSGEKSKTKNIY